MCLLLIAEPELLVIALCVGSDRKELDSIDTIDRLNICEPCGDVRAAAKA